jgi:exopolysaccharide biosynthesis polyprenyl glycosylphosphotransferase
MTQTTRRLGVGAIDGIFALGIVAFGFLPGSHLHHSRGELLSARVTLPDVLFSIGFIYLWRYCFSLLKLYDKFATISSRMLTTLKGVALMIIVAILYYRVAHPHILTLRAVIVTFLALYCYEINRASFSSQFLDRIAARDPRRAVIIGSGRRASKAWRAVRTRYRLSLKLIGFIDDRHPDEMAPDVARRYLGSMDELNRIILREVVDLILIAMPIQSCYPHMQRAIHIAESAGIQVLYLDDIYSTRNRKDDPNQTIFRDLAPDQDKYLLFLATKRLLDIIGATLGLVLLSPLFLIIAIAIKLTSKGPVLFRQERYGHRRRRFTMLRFRTKVYEPARTDSKGKSLRDADSQMHEHRADPPLLPFGTLLRNTSLDELPQLWNVLRGDMSLVGPRPISFHDVSLFDSASLVRRFSVQPGMTGLWQISGRGSTGVEHSVLLDNSYIDKRSLFFDLKILVQTIGVVVKRSGAV